MMIIFEVEVIIVMVIKGFEVIVCVLKYSVGYIREGWINVF